MVYEAFGWDLDKGWLKLKEGFVMEKRVDNHQLAVWHMASRVEDVERRRKSGQAFSYYVFAINTLNFLVDLDLISEDEYQEFWERIKRASENFI